MTTQLNRLVSDHEKLQQYIARLEQQGNKEMLDKLLEKKNYLAQSIAEYQEQVA